MAADGFFLGHPAHAFDQLQSAVIDRFRKERTAFFVFLGSGWEEEPHPQIAWSAHGTAEEMIQFLSDVIGSAQLELETLREAAGIAGPEEDS